MAPSDDDLGQIEEDEDARKARKAREGNDGDRDGNDGDSAMRQRLEAFIPEMVKRTFAAGMGAVFNTEEGIRKIAGEMSLPKDVAGYLANTAGNTKDELVKIVAREVREFLETMNLGEEVAKMLTTLSFEIKTEIRFIPNDEKLMGVTPDVKAKVRLKKQEAKEKRRTRRRRRRSGKTDELGTGDASHDTGRGSSGSNGNDDDTGK